MDNYHLSPRTAFGSHIPMNETIGAATLAERPDFAIASVAARSGQLGVVAIVTDGTDVGVAKSVQSGARTVFWSGPNQWFVLADHEAEETLAQMLKADLGDAASVTEQNDGWVVFDLTGARLEPILERLCSINLMMFDAGSVQRTVIKHVACFVICIEEGAAYRLLCGRSFASSFVHAITETMVSVDAQAQRIT